MGHTSSPSPLITPILDMGAVELRNGVSQATSQQPSTALLLVLLIAAIKSKQPCSAFLVALLILVIFLIVKIHRTLIPLALHKQLLWRKGLRLYCEQTTAWKNVKFLLFYNKFRNFLAVLFSWSFSGRLRPRQCIWRTQVSLSNKSFHSENFMKMLAKNISCWQTEVTHILAGASLYESYQITKLEYLQNIPLKYWLIH